MELPDWLDKAMLALGLRAAKCLECRATIAPEPSRPYTCVASAHAGRYPNGCPLVRVWRWQEAA